VGFELAIFDNDGVLIDSEPIGCGVLSFLLSEWGYRRTPEQCLADFQGTSFSHLRELVQGRTGRRLPDDFHTRYQELLFSRFRSELQTVPGVRAALERIPLRKCVASSASRSKVRFTLDVTGLAPFFGEDFYGAHGLCRGKPAPDIFFHAAEQMGVDPSRCAVIEDSRAGVEAANGAGMACFAYCGRTRREQLKPDRGSLFDAMDKLPALLAST
jgi:HAD superfamily hydrolase (TIGR01509 family)